MVPASTRTEIAARLAGLASAQQVKVLFACESGSRAWGFPSPDSDYDVRFVYAHPLPWYLSVEERRDVIETPLEATDWGLFDMGGWDVRKMLRLVRKSNPVIWEWLQSPIIYAAMPEDTLAALRQAVDSFYSPVAACHHYLALCRHTMERELTGPSVKIKKYFYMLRPILAAAWISQYRSVPPMEFAPLLAMVSDQPDILAAIHALLESKQTTDERIPIPRVAIIDQFLAEECERLKIATPNLPAANGDKSALDGIFHKLLDWREA
jgi:hypothetical protein